MRNFGYVFPDVIKGKIKDDVGIIKNIPTKFDVRDTFKLSPVVEQGSEQICSAIAVVTFGEYLNNLNNNDFTPYYIFNNRRDKNTNGMRLSEAIAFVKSYGFKTYKEYRKDRKPSKQRLITDTYGIYDREEMKEAIYTNGMGIVALTVSDDSKLKFWENSKGSNYGHTVCLVGYNDEDGCFILRNSWGTDYGYNGYAFLPYEDFDNYVIESWTIKK